MPTAFSLVVSSKHLRYGSSVLLLCEFIADLWPSVLTLCVCVCVTVSSTKHERKRLAALAEEEIANYSESDINFIPTSSPSESLSEGS